MNDVGAAAHQDTPASKRGIWGWIFFDWATQPFHTLIFTFVFAPYFAAYVAPDPAKGQELWGLATGIGGLLIAFTSPVLGAVADAVGPRKPFIFAFSVIGVIACAALWFATPGMENMTLILVAIAFGVFGMEYAAVFNNAMMPYLVPRSELGRLSGSAWGFGYVGGLLSLVLVLGFMSAPPDATHTLLGFEPIFGLDPAQHEGDRASGPLTALWYIVFVLPMFLFTPDQPRNNVSGAVGTALRRLWQTLRTLPKQRSYFSFLMSSMLYRDALNALYAFGGIYAAGVLNWTIVQIGIFGIIAALTGAIGAWLGGLADKAFGPKSVVVGSALILVLCCLLVISTTNDEILFIEVGEGSTLPTLAFYIAGAFIGAAGGSIQASSRTLLVDQVPRERVTEAFGLFALSGKATSFIGPLSIAAMTAWMTSQAFSPETAQRVGVAPILVLFIASLVLLPFVRGEKGSA
ncbi:MFS transporter [Nitratireductor aestuarii]|uniref:MFS transporter n=1 Tax=Nitratireductor aestuarii TaxID=1735103 RepID=A0A916RNX8_9HYPH|nr:MFS transporter [Nitratireductor aestuarii]GGA60845.1 MFS transporter [Nitratireductor aestuarii]